MAEAFGIAASIVQIADLGARLSLKLFTFGRQIKGAEQSLESAAKDVGFTCSVLKQLSESLNEKEQAQLYNSEALVTARDVAKECEKVFGDLEVVLDDKGIATAAQEGSFKDKFRKMASKVKYPFIEPQIEFLRSNLDRLKSTLVLMLQVIIYAGQLRSNTGVTALQEQRNIILQLTEEKDANDKKYHELVNEVQGMQIVEPQVSSGQNLPAKKPSESSIHSLPPIYTLLNTMHNVPQPENLQHYKTLVDRLLIEVDGIQYRIDEARRSRMRDYILFAHRRELDGMKATYGEKQVVTLFSEMPSSLKVSELAKSEEYVEKRPELTPSPPPPSRPAKAPRRSIFSPIDDPGSVLSQHFRASLSGLPPPPPSNNTPRRNTVRPRLSVRIPSEDPDGGNSTAESSPRGSVMNETATSRVDSKNDSSKPARPTTPQSSATLPSAGSQTLPNPFSKPTPDSESQRKSSATSNRNEEEVAKAFPPPLPIPDAGLLPSPSSFYPNWGLNHSTNQETTVEETTPRKRRSPIAAKPSLAELRKATKFGITPMFPRATGKPLFSKDPEFIGQLPTWEERSGLGSPSNETPEKKRKTSRYPDGSKAWETTEGTIIPGPSRLPQSRSDTLLPPLSQAPSGPPLVSATYSPGRKSLGPGKDIVPSPQDLSQSESYPQRAELKDDKIFGINPPNTSVQSGNSQCCVFLGSSPDFEDGNHGKMPELERTPTEKPEKDEVTDVVGQLLLKWTNSAPTCDA